MAECSQPRGHSVAKRAGPVVCWAMHARMRARARACAHTCVRARRHACHAGMQRRPLGLGQHTDVRRPVRHDGTQAGGHVALRRMEGIRPGRLRQVRGWCGSTMRVELKGAVDNCAAHDNDMCALGDNTGER